MYQNGLGVNQDYRQAIKWYRLVAEQGIANSQSNLGGMYDQGMGVLQDYKEAVKWYQLAAEQGLAQAQYNLGAMYYDGLGVLKDNVSAHMWFTLSGSHQYLNVLEKHMNPQQIEKAQEMARNWKPRKGNT